MTPSEQEASMTQEQLDLPRLRELALKATPGPWHHCQPYMVVPAQKTVHGTVPAERVDYVSTWPDRGTPPGHRVVIPMPTECGPGVRSSDMAFIAAANPATILRLLDRLDQLTEENERLRTGGFTAKDGLRWVPKDSRDAAEERATKVEAERDEAIKDRDAHAAHVLRLAAEAKAGFAALEEIDACWEAYGTASNRKHLTLSEQIASTLRELEDMSENYGNAEGELKMAEAERDSLTQLLADSDEAWNILTQAVLERTRERDEAQKDADVLDWLAENANLDLSYGYDDEWEEMSWRVHRVSGNVNDREWTLLSTGKTPLAALNDARALLARSAQGGEHV